MFRELINKPIDPITYDYVQANMVRLNCEPDYSLTSLGLAMLKKRIPDYKGIAGRYYSYPAKDTAVTDFIEAIKAVDDCPLFCYYRYNSDVDINSYLETSLSEFKDKKSITAFVKDKTGSDCLVLYHEEKNIVGIFVNSGDIRLYHLMLSFISLYFPSLFKETPLDDNDYAIIKSLSKKDKNEFYASIKNALAPYAIEFRRLQLVTFMKGLHEVKINAAKNQVESQKVEVQRLESDYSGAISILRRLIVEYEGLKATESYDGAEEDLVEYLTMNSDVRCLSLRDNRLFFAITGRLNNYNVDAWNTFSRRGTIYDGEYGTRLPEVFKSVDNRKLLLDNIFSEEPLLTVKMCGNYCLRFEDCRVTCEGRYNYTDYDPIFESYMPNPHIYYHACLGGYKDRVMQALKQRNYIGAIELCVASTGSVNLDETTMTFRPFLGQLLSSKQKVLINKEGQEMTPEEALVWLADQKKEEEK